MFLKEKAEGEPQRQQWPSWSHYGPLVWQTFSWKIYSCVVLPQK